MTTPDSTLPPGFSPVTPASLDRRRFERLFSGGDARPVRDAVAAFRNSDGGFGHALEPDGRMPASQPAAVGMALRTLDEADAWDEELVAGGCEWLARNAPAEGGAGGLACHIGLDQKLEPGLELAKLVRRQRHASVEAPEARSQSTGSRGSSTSNQRRGRSTY